MGCAWVVYRYFFALPGQIRQIGGDAVLDMAEPIPAQMLAAIPPRHHDDMALHPLALEHAQDDRSRSGFAIIGLDLGPVGRDHRPSVMGRLGEFLIAFQGLDEILGGVFIGNRATRHGIARSPILDNTLYDPHRIRANLPRAARFQSALRSADACQGNGCPDRESA